jgi:hypothetical protein
VTLSLRGTAAGVGKIGFTPPIVQIGTVVGSSVIQAITVSNTGTGPVSIRGIHLVPVSFGSFVIAGNGCANATLAPGGSCQVTVQFFPAGLFFFGPPAVAQLVVDSNLQAPTVLTMNGTLRSNGG